MTNSGLGRGLGSLIPKLNVTDYEDAKRPSFEDKVLDISEVFQVKDKFYSILKITGNQKIRVLGDDNKALGLDDKLLYALKLKFDQQYGAENVKFNEQTKFFSVKVDQTIIAISYDGTTEWKYLAIDSLKLDIITKLLPQEVLNKVLAND